MQKYHNIANRILNSVRSDRMAIPAMKTKAFILNTFKKQNTSAPASEQLLINKAFWEQARTLTPSKTQRSQSLNTIKTAAAGKTFHRTPSFRELLCTQLQYISPSFWLLQGSFVVLLIVILNQIDLTRRNLTDYLYWISVLAAWMGTAVCSSLDRHFSRRMAELEQSCYLNITQMWTVKMILSGCMDIIMLVFCCGKIALDTALPFGQVCVYVLVPFVLSNLYCLFMLTALRFGRLRYGLPILAFSAGVGAVLLTKLPPIFYTLSFLWIWCILLAAGTILLFCQIKRINKKIWKGEMLCWN